MHRAFIRRVVVRGDMPGRLFGSENAAMASCRRVGIRAGPSRGEQSDSLAHCFRDVVHSSTTERDKHDTDEVMTDRYNEPCMRTRHSPEPTLK